MDINAAIFGRRSVREYTTQSVDPQMIHGLIDAAVHAPNAVNQQPWTFTVVRDQTVLARVSDSAKRHMLATMSPSRHSDYFRSRLSEPDSRCSKVMSIASSAQASLTRFEVTNICEHSGLFTTRG
jgi:nitroreductase